MPIDDRRDPEELKSYLQGKLPESEVDRVELRLLAEGDLFELSEAVADELIEAAVREDSTLRQSPWLARLAASPEGRARLDFWRALVPVLDEHQRSAAEKTSVLPAPLPFPRPPRRWIERPRRVAALAASLVAATVAVCNYIPPVPPHEDGAGNDGASHPTRFVPDGSMHPLQRAVFQLALEVTRGVEPRSGAMPEPPLMIDDARQPIRIEVGLGAREKLATFTATVTSMENASVWTGKGLPPQADGAKIVLDLPPGTLSTGQYWLSITRTGESEPLGERDFEVVIR